MLYIASPVLYDAPMETPMDTTRFTVAFAADSDPQFAARGRGPKPRPATCSTPAVALGLVEHFGTAQRLYVSNAEHGQLATYDISRVDLTKFDRWFDLIETIRKGRRHAKTAAE